MEVGGSPRGPFEIDPARVQLIDRLKTEDSGLGEIWLGELLEGSGRRKVAVKRYPSVWIEQEMDMFRRETEVLFLAAMRCHNVCKVYGTTIKDGKLCIVMRLYRQSLQDLIQQQPSRALGLPLVKKYAAEICKAVAELHEQNIVLQDLKPANILLDDLDHCVVADFGISKILQENSLHMPSNVQGTFNYMSPEAFDPERFCGISSKADSWSFACTLIEMLSGQRPWQDVKMAKIISCVLDGAIPPLPPGLPPAIRSLLLACFSFDPRARPTFAEMFEIIRSWEGEERPDQPAYQSLRMRKLEDELARERELRQSLEEQVRVLSGVCMRLRQSSGRALSDGSAEVDTTSLVSDSDSEGDGGSGNVRTSGEPEIESPQADNGAHGSREVQME
eukprot:758936-Hanusia_phi.AAC.1